MLSAGTAVEWLRDDLGRHRRSAATPRRWRRRATDTGDVWFVPALLGLGTPAWDFGARGTLLGLTRGTGRAEMVRAVLEGVAHRGADLVEAAEADSGPAHRRPAGRRRHERQPRSFVQALADACRPPGRDLAGGSRPPRWAPPSWPAWPSASGPTRRRWPPPGRPGPGGAGGRRRPGPLAGGRANGPGAGSPSCRPSSSDRRSAGARDWRRR